MICRAAVTASSASSNRADTTNAAIASTTTSGKLQRAQDGSHENTATPGRGGRGAERSRGGVVAVGGELRQLVHRVDPVVDSGGEVGGPGEQVAAYG